MPEKKSRKTVYRWLMVLGYMSFIFYLSSGPVKIPLYNRIPYADKLAHLASYSILGWLVFGALKSSVISPKAARYVWLYTVLICVLYGASDEIHQFFVPQRQMEMMDLVCDGLGGLLVSWFLVTKP